MIILCSLLSNSGLFHSLYFSIANNISNSAVYMSSVLMQFIMRDNIRIGLERALSTGNWDVKRFKMSRKGVTQVVYFSSCSLSSFAYALFYRAWICQITLTISILDVRGFMFDMLYSMLIRVNIGKWIHTLHEYICYLTEGVIC